MQTYQEQYINNAKTIAELSIFYKGHSQGFDAWKKERESAEKKIHNLKAENIELLNSGLFPTLDGLYSASEETICDLNEFAGILLDWKTNLDCGVYLIIHDALLKYYRLKKDRNNIIKELYMVGMGYYYIRRFCEGIASDVTKRFAFRNEMIFTEAASYLKYFDDIADDEIRGYIIRALHNITLCVKDIKRRVTANNKALNTMRDRYYQDIAPSLPWDRFIRASHQQMSINRQGLSKAGLSKEELAGILDSCYEVFKPEESAENRNIRWLWPYYEMEYNCGYVDLNTTMDRMEELIDSVDSEQYDISGLYANVQLPLFYGQYLRNNIQLQTDENRIRFLDKANRKMLKTLLSCPAAKFDAYFYYNIDIAISNFYEIEGSLQYKELAEKFLRRFSGDLYVKSRKAGDLMKILSESILEKEPDFFDDIPFIKEIAQQDKKRECILTYAQECGLFMDFGIIKMNIQRTMNTRQLFEIEHELYQLHGKSGYDDFKHRESTKALADIAHGHHRWYNGEGGYPSDYIRNDSPYRQMTDIAAVVSFMISEWENDIDKLIDKVLSCPSGRFSPIVISFLGNQSLKKDLEKILSESSAYYKEIYDELLN